MAEFILEIGAEDIPARFMPDALLQIKSLAEKELNAAGIEFGKVDTFGTHRRFTLHVSDLVQTQKDREEEISGPPASIAFDDKGNPTKAAHGFAKKQGVDVKDLLIIDSPKGKVLCARKFYKGSPTSELLPQIAKNIICGISFSKTMRWGDGDFRFVRPLKWIAAIFDGNVLSFSIEDIVSSNATYGHRFIAPEKIEFSSFADYAEKLEKAGVMLNQDKRKEILNKNLHNAAIKAGGTLVENEDLLNLLTYMAEYPGVIAGHFPEKYLALPDEVLLCPMQKQQMYFAVKGTGKDGEGRLLNAFAATYDRDKDVSGNIKNGNERVLRARLADAMFFFEEDLKVPLAERIDELKRVVFLEKLGSIYDKVHRIKGIAGKLSSGIIKNLSQNFDSSVCERAALLCKNDLLTDMVKEFPELQGIMGREYFFRQGEVRKVSDAVFEHYLPRFSTDSLPGFPESAVLAIADRIDTISGCFSIGLIPTGSEDPFGLRRAAIGIINIIAEKGFSVDINELIDAGLSFYGIDDGKKKEAAAQMKSFFMTRYQNILDSKNYRSDIVNSVIAARFDDINDATQRVEALERLRIEPWFESLSIAFKRAMRIIPQGDCGEGSVKAQLLTDEGEKILFASVERVENKSRTALAVFDYYGALKIVCSIKEDIDRFFDEVLVMAEDEALKNNRLNILRRIVRLFSDIADFRQISPGKNN
ncbi:MAG: glycine--tRNA ligase subunit beta [Candidatus Schekmanbacteria bacterium]|nr:glycine--tRNA ligase subunit beta [Candidatus Schekmanbacteria bacterium]